MWDLATNASNKKCQYKLADSMSRGFEIDEVRTFTVLKRNPSEWLVFVDKDGNQYLAKRVSE